MKRKQKCTMCGKKFEMHDTCADLHFEKRIGYASIYDGETLKLDLCCDCFDHLVNHLDFICKEDIFLKK